MKMPRLNILGWIVVLAAVLGIGWAIVMTVKLKHAQAASASNALATSNAIAERDVSRAVSLARKDSIKIFGDSLHASERLAVQPAKPIKSDALDRATNRKSVARGSVTVTPGNISTSASSSPTTLLSDDVRSAHFHVDSSGSVAGPRYVADADVKVPPPPAAATLALGVTLSPITLSPRIQCGPPDRAGVRPATLLVEGPAGVPIGVGRTEVDVHTCNPDFGRPTGIRVPLTFAVLLALASATAAALLTH
jgi:hypothetical protein